MSCPSSNTLATLSTSDNEQGIGYVINFTDKSDFDAALRDFLPDKLQPTSPRWLASLLSTNDPPTLCTRHSLLTALDIHEEESDKLDAKLSDSIHLLDFIADQVLATKTHVRDIKTVTHPIRVVPDEVWREIHLFAVAGSATTRPSIYDTPWRLAQVCHRWRVVAINTGALWSNIRLFFSNDQLLSNPKNADDACSILAEHLTHCRSSPHDITIHAPYLHLQDNPVFNLLIMHTTSWMSLAINTNAVNYGFLQCRQGFFNSLESLRISDMEYYESPTVVYDEHALDAFFFSPKMTLFDIPDIPVTDLALAPAANASIRHLGISLAGQALEVMNTLESMPCLTCLDLTCNESSGTTMPTHTVKLFSLQRLLLRDPLSTNAIRLLWRRIRVPTLTCLALCYEGEDIDKPIYPSLIVPHTHITDFCIYLESDIDSAELYEPALVAMLYNLPNVAVLELRSTNTWPLIVEELCNHGECLPHLSRPLYLVEYPPENSEAANVVRMLHRRKSMSSCTHIIHLSVFGNPIMDRFTQNEWDVLLDDRAHPMELMRVHDGRRYTSRAFLTEDHELSTS